MRSLQSIHHLGLCAGRRPDRRVGRFALRGSGKHHGAERSRKTG